MKKISIAVLLLTGHCMYGQSARLPPFVRYTSVGAGSKNFTDVFSGTVNQASLADINNAGAAVYAERRFMLKELSNYAAAIALPTKYGGFGLAVNYFGSSSFNSSRVGIGYGKKLSDKINIGIQFNYNMLKLEGYGSSGVINIEAGAVFHLTQQLHFGLHVYNPAGGKFGLGKAEKLASVYTTALGYEVSDKVFISASVSKEEDQPVTINAGMQYVFAQRLFARAGLATQTGNYFFGVGLYWKNIRMDVVSGWQAQLGYTPALMFIFNFHASSNSPKIED